jgi:hypothetical protein
MLHYYHAPLIDAIAAPTEAGCRWSSGVTVRHPPMLSFGVA